MRASLLAALVLLTYLAGCANQGPLLSIERSVLDSTPVVPLVTELGVSTAWLNEDSTLVTVSHGLPRSVTNGVAEVASIPVHYRVLASGDRLEREWERWNPLSRSGQTEDWALIVPDPMLRCDPQSPHGHVAWSSQPPVVGELLVLIGYSREGEVVERYVMTVRVIEVPDAYAASDTGHHVWFRTTNGRKLRQGFSGAPLLRLRNDGALEPVAMMVGAGNQGQRLTDIGVATLVTIE